MAVPKWRTEMRLHTDIFEIFDDESVNSTFRNKKMAEPKWLSKN